MIGDVVDRLVVPAIVSGSTPGAAVVVLDGDEELLLAYGNVERGPTPPVTPATPFAIEGLTKPVVATAVTALASDGRLDLSLPVAEILGLDAPPAVRVDHLLAHLSGLPDDASVAPAALLGGPQLAPAGALYSYSNAAFGLLGAVVEAVTRRTFAAALHELVLSPLGMTASGLLRSEPGAVAPGHTGDLVLRAPPYGPGLDAALGLTASAEDMSRFLRAHLDGHATMQRPVASADGVFQVARGWFVRRSGAVDVDAVVMQHGGGGLGNATLAALVPTRRVAVAVLANSGAAGGLKLAVVAAVLRELAGVEPVEASAVAIDDAELDGCVGRFEDPTRTVTVERQGDRLGLEVVTKPDRWPHAPAPPPPPWRAVVAFRARGSAFEVDGPGAGAGGEFGHEFVTDAEGRVAWVRAASKLAVRVGSHELHRSSTRSATSSVHRS